LDLLLKYLYLIYFLFFFKKKTLTKQKTKLLPALKCPTKPWFHVQRDLNRIFFTSNTEDSQSSKLLVFRSFQVHHIKHK
jgi:hypothetical protein